MVNEAREIIQTNQYYIPGELTYNKWNVLMGRLDKFPFPVGWDTIVSDITQLKEKITKVYDFIDSMINDWAYHDYAYAYNASDFFSRQKMTELFKACGLFNNNPEYASSLNEIFDINSNIINGFILLKSRCINLKEECDKIINYVNVINNYVTSAFEHLKYIGRTMENRYMQTDEYAELAKKGPVTYTDFIPWWNRNPYQGEPFERKYSSLKKFDLHEESVAR